MYRGGKLMASTLINVPATARRGDIIEIKTLMSHIMETGFRHTVTGEVIPRNIITNFTCRYNGDEVFRADLFPAFSANPFISFFTIATESGKFEFQWIGDNGFQETASASITVT
jgi:sulfur-oxidizing protein SoxZ